jgi:glycosyltransferase involved in cell wall biosynthesis
MSGGRQADAGGGSRLTVGVGVDLLREPTAGGHVKCWERLAEAAAGRSDLDLTVHFLGERRAVVPLAPNVRYVLLRPVLPTASLALLDGMPDHTDLAPVHPRLLAALRRCDVVHTTDAFFAMARTAELFVRWSGRPLVHSLHTDTPSYTRVYSAEALRRLLGAGRLAALVLDRWRWHERLGRMMQRRLERYLRRCDWVLGPEDDGAEPGGAAAARPGRVSVLRRGIDKRTFDPRLRDRARLDAAFGIAPGRLAVLSVGRVSAGKDAMTLAQAARLLLDRGVPVHLIAVGKGDDRAGIRALLGDRVSLPGALPQSELPWIYAGADLFAFPSRIEVFPNVVLEAMASGLPVVVANAGGSARLGRRAPEAAVLVDGDTPAAWAEAIEALRREPERRAGMGRAARRFIETSWPAWEDVLVEDLLPVWRRVAEEARARREGR